MACRNSIRFVWQHHREMNLKVRAGRNFEDLFGGVEFSIYPPRSNPACNRWD